MQISIHVLFFTEKMAVNQTYLTRSVDGRYHCCYCLFLAALILVKLFCSTSHYLKSLSLTSLARGIQEDLSNLQKELIVILQDQGSSINIHYSNHFY